MDIVYTHSEKIKLITVLPRSLQDCALFSFSKGIPLQTFPEIHPISMCNFSLIRAVGVRLSSLLPKLNSPNQRGFECVKEIVEGIIQEQEIFIISTLNRGG